MRFVIVLMSFLFLGLTSSFQIFKLGQHLIDETDGKYKLKNNCCVVEVVVVVEWFIFFLNLIVY